MITIPGWRTNLTEDTMALVFESAGLRRRPNLASWHVGMIGVAPQQSGIP
ncbi:hypothetical protein [Micromonospora echinofusca]|uniref:Uncharacterized protein n=1 Tax=Micromonospora echinofusca TaxID=47858 RepID=A0A1C5GI35_MICEH|nr:hypothetical protein [Micromonospora echinofusca]SCG19470.1 hypothetical protein GA0070610_5845 [Micromonospora echinofusca]